MTVHRHSFPYRGQPVALAKITPDVPLTSEERQRTNPYVKGEADPTFSVWIEQTRGLRVLSSLDIEEDIYTVEGGSNIQVCFLSERARDQFVKAAQPPITIQQSAEWWAKKLELEDDCDVGAGVIPQPVHWFAERASRLAADLGFRVSPLKLRDLLSLAEGDIDLWSFLSLLPFEHRAQYGDEWLNFILGPLAVGMKASGVGFSQREHVLVAQGCMMFLEALVADKVTSAIRKDLYEALIARFNNEWWQSADKGEDTARAIFSAILKDVAPPEIDMGALGELIVEVIADNPEQALKAKDDPKLVGWFMGQIMRKMATKIDPNVVRAAILERLS